MYTCRRVRGWLAAADTMFGRQFPSVEGMLRGAAGDMTAFLPFPASDHKKIWSTDSLERLNKETKRRTDIAGLFPNLEALCAWQGPS